MNPSDYFPEKVKFEKGQIFSGGAGVLTVSFPDLGKTTNLLDSVEDEMVRGIPSLQNLVVVCPKIERFPDYVFLDFLNILEFSAN